MKNISHLFIPVKHNDHRPYLTRHPALALFLLLIMTVQTTLNIFTSTRPQILGFATSIYQQEIISYTNQEREKDGLPALVHNAKLDEAAKLKAQDMFAKNYWAHVSPDGIDPWHWFAMVNYDYTSAGENLAQGFDTSRGVISGWMASPSHRENILYNKFTEIGVAILNGNLEGEDTTLVVQLFGTPPATAPAVVAQAQPTIKPTVIATKAPTQKPAPTVQLIPTDIPASPTATSTPSSLQQELAVQPTNLPTQITTITDNTPTPNPEVIVGPSGDFTNTPPSRLTMVMAAVSDLRNLSPARIFTIIMISFIVILFLIDSIVLWYKKVHRQNAHRLIYASILVIALINIIYSSVGLVL
ncbi:hypothetical protein HGA91_00690 [candidate division WWE3 bacterium]|nr:hypothetical protein [candidate division WWE3 bacterium]